MHSDRLHYKIQPQTTACSSSNDATGTRLLARTREKKIKHLLKPRAQMFLSIQIYNAQKIYISRRSRNSNEF